MFHRARGEVITHVIRHLHRAPPALQLPERQLQHPADLGERAHHEVEHPAPEQVSSEARGEAGGAGAALAPREVDLEHGLGVGGPVAVEQREAQVAVGLVLGGESVPAVGGGGLEGVGGGGVVGGEVVGEGGAEVEAAEGALGVAEGEVLAFEVGERGAAVGAPGVLEETEEVARGDGTGGQGTGLDHPLGDPHGSGFEDALVHELVTIQGAVGCADEVGETVRLEGDFPCAGLAIIKDVLGGCAEIHRLIRGDEGQTFPSLTHSLFH